MFSSLLKGLQEKEFLQEITIIDNNSDMTDLQTNASSKTMAFAVFTEQLDVNPPANPSHFDKKPFFKETPCSVQVKYRRHYMQKSLGLCF